MHKEFSWQNITFFLLTLVVLVLCALVLHPFFSAIIAAIALAIVTKHPYDWLAKRIRSPNLCASVALILVLLAIVIPAYYLGAELAGQAIATVNSIRDQATQQKILDFIAGHPALAWQIASITSSIDPREAARASAAYFGQHLGALLGSSIHTLTQLVVMLFILFFLLRDRALALSLLRSLLPLREDETTQLLRRLDDTIHATALGRLLIAAIQGILAGLAYWLLGVPDAILLSFTTAVAALIPGFGTMLVWAPVALYLGFAGHWGRAAILALWGGVIVSTIDNLLYPILIGPRLRAHTVTILLSILGGIALFGITGIILGPVTFTAAQTLLEFWRNRTNETDF
jgi:predicted PurR-regulated permease PerM